MSSSALYFVILIGIVSLCADATYEGGRSIAGAYLGFLGASAPIVGFVAGAGELVGFALRLGAGYLSDRTQQYWLLTTIGFIINTGAIPLLALTNNWYQAALLLVLERAGRAVRSPPRDVLLSHAAHQLGSGLGFGIHEALDQIGAVAGPLVVSAILLSRQSYTDAFAVLVIPCLFGLVLLILMQQRYPNPRQFEPESTSDVSSQLPHQFWLYVCGTSLLAIGYADFPLIAFHFERSGQIPLERIPQFYAVAMAMDAIAALGLGILLDRTLKQNRSGNWVMAIAVVVSSFAVPLVFGGNSSLGLLGMALWGIGMGAQESIMKAILAVMIPIGQRGRAFGVFYVVFGIAWLLGSSLMGVLYEYSILGLIMVSVGTQMLSVFVLLRLCK